jgi:hypothetical protein
MQQAVAIDSEGFRTSCVGSTLSRLYLPQMAVFENWVMGDRHSLVLAIANPVSCAQYDRIARCEVPVTHCEVPVTHCEVPATHCKVPTTHCKVPITECKVPTTHCKVPITECKVPTTHCKVPITECKVLVIECKVSVSEYDCDRTHSHCTFSHRILLFIIQIGFTVPARRLRRAYLRKTCSSLLSKFTQFPAG